MTLNFSRRPVFPPSEDNFVSSLRMREGVSTDRPLSFGWEFEDTHHHHRDRGRDRGDRGGSSEPIANDILDLLPSDPFGMNIGATFSAITGWIEDWEMDELNFMWNNAFNFQSQVGANERWNSSHCTFDGGFVSADELSNFCDKYIQAGGCQGNEAVMDVASCSNSSEGVDPHEALLYALGYLNLHELLSVESVCRSLRSVVQNDPLLWRNMYIDQPLSERIDDDALLRLSNRAQGNLQCLSLVECSKITDDGLKRVLENNPKLTKLSVPGCTRLSIDGIVNNLRAFKSLGSFGLKKLRIGGRYGVTQTHFEELKVLLGVDDEMETKSHKPRFYRSGYLSVGLDDDRAIDIEMCPRCENLRLVYDCPSESCLGKGSSSQLCRGCTMCIARCDQCGRCINDSEYEETFCLDLLCSECLKQEEKGVPLRNNSCNQMMYG